jgi:hypothetical protein
MGSPPAPQQPAPRDIGQETRDSLQAQVDLAPQVYESEAVYKPLYADLDTATLERTLLGTAATPDQTEVVRNIQLVSAGRQASGDKAGAQAVVRINGRIATPKELGQLGLNDLQGITTQAQLEQMSGLQALTQNGVDEEGNPVYVTSNGTAPKSITWAGQAAQRGLLDIYENDLYPFARDQAVADQAAQESLQSSQRAADIADIEVLGGRARDAFRAANPIISELSDQALEDVRLRGRLSPEELREVEQRSRAEFSNRGLVRSNPAVVSEFLNRDTVTRNKMFQDRDFALRVAGMEQDPWLAVLGRPGSQVNSTAAAQGTFGNAGYALNSGNDLFGFSQAQFADYAQNLNQDNFEQANNFAILSANAKAAGRSGVLGLAGAGIGAAGTVGAAF